MAAELLRCIVEPRQGGQAGTTPEKQGRFSFTPRAGIRHSYVRHHAPPFASRETRVVRFISYICRCPPLQSVADAGPGSVAVARPPARPPACACRQLRHLIIAHALLVWLTPADVTSVSHRLISHRQTVTGSQLPHWRLIVLHLQTRIHVRRRVR